MSRHKCFKMKFLGVILGVMRKVPETGLEPAHLSILDPKSSASTNSAIPACGDFTGRAGRGKNSIGRAVKFQIWVARGGAAVAERVLSFKVLEGHGERGVAESLAAESFLKSRGRDLLKGALAWLTLRRDGWNFPWLRTGGGTGWGRFPGTPTVSRRVRENGSCRRGGRGG